MVSERWRNKFSRGAGRLADFGNHQLGHGRPLGIGYSFVQAVEITGVTGAGVDSRVILTGDPNLLEGERTMYRSSEYGTSRASRSLGLRYRTGGGNCSFSSFFRLPRWRWSCVGSA